MIDRMKITNFKSIVDAELRFGRVNIFIGANGAGKSNVLEALGVVSAALSSGVTATDLDFRGVRQSLPRLFKATFKNRTVPKNFTLEVSSGEAKYRLSLRAGEKRKHLEFHTESIHEEKRLLVGRSNRGLRIHRPTLGLEKQHGFPLEKHAGLWPQLSSLVDAKDDTRQALAALRSYRIFTPQTAVMRGVATDPRDGKTGPLGLTGGRLAEALREVLLGIRRDDRKWEAVDELLKIIWEPGWANQVKTGTYDPDIVPSNVPSMPRIVYIRDEFMKTGRNYLSAFDASEGTLYLIFVATLLAHQEAPRIFALDNVDGTLNPRLVRRLVEHIVNTIGRHDRDDDLSPRTQQVFLTSHNPTALDALDLFDPGQKVFVVSRDKVKRRGATTITPLIPPEGMTKEQWIEAKQGRNLSQLWLDNAIQDALG